MWHKSLRHCLCVCNTLLEKSNKGGTENTKIVNFETIWMEKEPFLRLSLSERSFYTCSVWLGSMFLNFFSSLKDSVTVTKKLHIPHCPAAKDKLWSLCISSHCWEEERKFSGRESVSGDICYLIRSGATAPK